jgi:hypothetical protein
MLHLMIMLTNVWKVERAILLLVEASIGLLQKPSDYGFKEVHCVIYKSNMFRSHYPSLDLLTANFTNYRRLIKKSASAW